MPSTDDILRKYGSRIESEIASYNANDSFSREYMQFKEDMLPEFSRYQRWTNTIGNLVKLKLSPKEENRL